MSATDSGCAGGQGKSAEQVEGDGLGCAIMCAAAIFVGLGIPVALWFAEAFAVTP